MIRTHEVTVSGHTMLGPLVSSLMCLVLVSAVCPPCPGPPVHACCHPSAQVEGVCCQVSKYQYKRPPDVEFNKLTFSRLMKNVVFLLTTTFHHIVLLMMCANMDFSMHSSRKVYLTSKF